MAAENKMAPRRKLNTFLFTITSLLGISSLFIYVTTTPTRIEPMFEWGNWKTNHPWAGDSECGSFETRIARPGSLAKRALASYPGSGNTWIRYLIEGASGIYTGSIFYDKSIASAGHHGEMRNHTDGSTILQKTHHRAIYVPHYSKYSLQWRMDHINMFGGRAVVVIRNPFKAILSYWNYISTKSHTASANKTSFSSQKFKDFAFVGINRWYEIISDWLKYGTEVYFVFYENLKENPVAEIRTLFDHLGVELDENRLNCIEKHLTGSFERTKHTEDNPFSSDHQELFRLVIDEASRRIEEKTGIKLPVEKYTFYSSETTMVNNKLKESK